MTFEEIIAQIGKKQFAPVYLLHGEEPFYIDEIASRIEEGVMDEVDRDFNQVVLYGKDSSVNEIIDNAKQYPFGVQYRVVIVREAQELGKNKQLDLLAKYAENPMESTILVICYKYGKFKDSKAFQKKGVVFLSEKVKTYNLAAWITKQVKVHNFTINPQAAAILAEQIGDDLTRINNELLKLKILLPSNSTITPEVIEKYIGISKEYNIFELQEALGERNISKAYKITYNFCLNQKENPNVKTITMLYSFYSKMLAYHLDPQKSPTIFSSNSYLAQRNVGYAQRYSLAELRKIIALLREFDLKAKGVDTSASPEDQLKELIYKILN